MKVSVIQGQDRAIAEWAGQRLGVVFQEPYCAFGFVGDDGELFAASVINDYYPGGNCEWTHYGPGLFSREMGAYLLNFVFNELTAARVTAKTRRGNVLVRKLLPRYGWEFEFVQKRYFGPTKDDDALVYVMWKERALRWIQGTMH